MLTVHLFMFALTLSPASGASLNLYDRDARLNAAATAFFNLFDTNHDGKVTEEEGLKELDDKAHALGVSATTIVQTFKQHDKNKDGILELEELRTNPSHEEISFLLKNYDVIQQSLSRKSIMRREKPSATDSSVSLLDREATLTTVVSDFFNLFDANHDGKITEDEGVKELDARAHALGIHSDVLAQTFKNHDKNQDGILELEEFKASPSPEEISFLVAKSDTIHQILSRKSIMRREKPATSEDSVHLVDPEAILNTAVTNFFNLFDSDHDGKITADEGVKELDAKAQALGVSSNVLVQTFEKHDKNKDGILEIEELKASPSHQEISFLLEKQEAINGIISKKSLMRREQTKKQ